MRAAYPREDSKWDERTQVGDGTTRMSASMRPPSSLSCVDCPLLMLMHLRTHADLEPTLRRSRSVRAISLPYTTYQCCHLSPVPQRPPLIPIQFLVRAFRVDASSHWCPQRGTFRDDGWCDFIRHSTPARFPFPFVSPSLFSPSDLSPCLAVFEALPPLQLVAVV